MEIELDGYKILIDDEDYDKIMLYKWHKRLHHNHIYFRSGRKENGRYVTIQLHRYLMGCVYKDGITVDHKDGDTLNNFKTNLRKCTTQENSMNRGKYVNNTSGYKGVFLKKDHFRKKPWFAVITVENKRKHLGYFETKELAYARYIEASKEYFKEFNRLQEKI